MRLLLSGIIVLTLSTVIDAQGGDDLQGLPGPARQSV